MVDDRLARDSQVGHSPVSLVGRSGTRRSRLPASRSVAVAGTHILRAGRGGRGARADAVHLEPGAGELGRERAGQRISWRDAAKGDLELSDGWPGSPGQDRVGEEGVPETAAQQASAAAAGGGGAVAWPVSGRWHRRSVRGGCQRGQRAARFLRSCAPGPTASTVPTAAAGPGGRNRSGPCRPR